MTWVETRNPLEDDGPLRATFEADAFPKVAIGENVGGEERLFYSTSSIERGQSLPRRRDNARSARSRPPVWHRAQ